MRPPTRRSARPALSITAALVAAAATTIALVGPALRPGFALYLDHVTVPDPARPEWQDLMAPTGLRAWPLSGVSWAWSQVLPAWAFQHLTILVAVLAAGAGMGVVLRRWGTVAAVSGSVLAIANPYVVERLLLGQGGLLLAYAMLPWIIVGSRQPTPGRRIGLVTLASVPAALTPWGSVIAAVGAVGVALIRRRSARETALQSLASTVLLLPWLVPALLASPGPADPRGAMAFRLADDTGMGTLGSALTGGGVWSAAAHLSSRHGAVGVVSTLAIVSLALLGAWTITSIRPRFGGALTATWLAIPVAAAVLSGPALRMWAELQTVPGVALFRDLHRLLAPAIVALVLLSAIGTRRLVSAATWDRPGAATALGVVLPVSLALMLVPGGSTRVHSAYAPGAFSPEWPRALSATQGSGLVLSLPWQPLRRVPWMPYPFLDPTRIGLGARTVADPTLSVMRDGEVVTVREMGGGSAGRPLHDTLVSTLTRPASEPLPSELLASTGIQHMLIWKGSPGTTPGRPNGWSVTFSGADFEVWSAEGSASR